MTDPTPTARVLAAIGPIPPSGHSAPSAGGEGGASYTDRGNAQRLVAAHRHRLRHVDPWGSWLVYDNGRWKRDTTGRAQEAAKSLSDLVLREAADLDGDARKAALGWVLKSENAARIAAALTLARTDPAIALDPAQLDADPWAFGCRNGTLDLRTGTLGPHRPEDLLTKQAGAAYHPDARAPNWHRFLEQILPDRDLRGFVQRSLGYALTGTIAEHHLWIAWGAGANGKSTLLNAVTRVLGEYAQTADPRILLAVGDDQHPTAMASLRGSRLVTTSELDDGRRLAEATVKRLTGGDPIRARYMRCDEFEFLPSWHLWLASNHRPQVAGTDHALWRRLRLVPFTVTVADDDQDPHLGDKLDVEADGILSWLVEGCLAWRTHGLGEPLAVRLATDDYRASQDAIGAFLTDHCAATPDATVGATELFGAYRTWADATGERPINQRRFGQALADRHHDRYRTGGGYRYKGLALLSEHPTLGTLSRDQEAS